MVIKTLMERKVKSREEFLEEAEILKFEALDEDTMINIDIMVDDDPKDVANLISKIDNVEKKEILPFGVIKARAMKKKIAEIKKLAGVEDVKIEREK